ncbi:S9 family peptidase [Hankyongella ginsenosidimutans]|uniref:S9 family peptidase n=1 Tax=Hankyongella ginsenosidimutans TaxID=1763828 RepID=A0A4D7CBR3_9SPHN|nr:hypothetical protein [Hankyongella ginsenosidimutans]QCI80056.1 S9 family peptidase [Hankyongella ginsenosidimutans]
MLRLLLLSFALLAMKTAPTLAQDDPHQWLEGVTDPKALDWVQQQNKRSLAVLEQQPRFADFRKRAEDIYADKRRIAYPDIQGDDVFNFWQDDANPRGLWRIATLKSYLTGKPAWRTLLDLDDLAKRENENWVWKGADCLGPVFNRCLVYLSRGARTRRSCGSSTVRPTGSPQTASCSAKPSTGSPGWTTTGCWSRLITARAA